MEADGGTANVASEATTIIAILPNLPNQCQITYPVSSAKVSTTSIIAPKQVMRRRKGAFLNG